MNPFLYFSSFVYKANERLCSDVNNNVYEIRVFLTTKSWSRDRSFITKSLNWNCFTQFPGLNEVF